MATSEELLNTIERKFKLLVLAEKDVKKALNNKKMRDLERQLNAINNRLNEMFNLKSSVQERMLENSENEEAVAEWSKNFDSRLEIYEESLDRIQSTIQEIKDAEEKHTQEREEQKQEERLKRALDEQRRIEELRLTIRKQAEIEQGKAKETAGNEITKVKLPKLTITKFNGTHEDWVRFWSQYEAEIDKTNVAQVTKFSYLKELLVPKVRSLIDGLPFTTEGYERAKNILKTKFGKTSEVINAHVQKIISLPLITSSRPSAIHDFYERLVTNVQALESLGKLNQINGYVRMTLDKLPAIRSDLVRTDNDWQEWQFPQLTEALQRWTERNPINREDNRLTGQQRERSKLHGETGRSFTTKDQIKGTRPCVYCQNDTHKSTECTNLKEKAKRKTLLKEQRRCFNCTREGHRASDCPSKMSCRNCKSRHHTSICDRQVNSLPSEQAMLTTIEHGVIYPVVVLRVNGIICRALLDTGAGSSYASAALLDRLHIRPVRKENRTIEMMMSTTNRKLEIFDLSISNLQSDFIINAEVSRVERQTLLTTANPNYQTLVKRYKHLNGIKMDDIDTKPELPIHMVLGASEYSRIKTNIPARVGECGQPIAEYTKFGWAIMSPGHETNCTNLYLTKTWREDFDNLCKLDVLGIEDNHERSDQNVFDEFKEQLTRTEEGWYQTGLLWKPNREKLQNNKANSLGRLMNLLKKLKRDPDLFQQYHQIIQDQLSQGIVEYTTEKPSGVEFYIPHRPVVKPAVESTKVRIVYDASSKPNVSSPSLNDCLETGPSLQNRIWDILVRCRLKPILLSGDLKQAFLQVRIREQDRDALRFHWIKDLEDEQIITLRFTRALFGLVQSPFLLGGTLDEHLSTFENNLPDITEEIKDNLYVDDVISGGETLEEVKLLKNKMIDIFKEGGFTLHKWNSNIPLLEGATTTNNQELSYAKQQLGVTKDESKILGVSWKKNEDLIGVTLAVKESEITKRGVLQMLASIYDPLGIISPTTLQGKIIYRRICELKIPWDKQLPSPVHKLWTKWLQQLPSHVEIPRPLAIHHERIIYIDLHVFCDASAEGMSAAVYVVVKQTSGINQGLLTSKSRLSKNTLTIPRLELAACHMGANLLANTKTALKRYPVRKTVGWTDSRVALHWIREEGNYKLYVNNRVKKIRIKDFIVWRHIKGTDNPADVGSRGSSVANLSDSWWNGPPWISKGDEKWPSDVRTTPSKETEVETKAIKEVLAMATTTSKDEFDLILEKSNYWKTLRIMSWVCRFIHNCKMEKCNRRYGPIDSTDITQQIQFWIKREQKRHSTSEEFKRNQVSLNIQLDHHGIYICKGRIEGEYPIYLPHESLFTKKLIENAHLKTLHGLTKLTMTEIRCKYWVPRLRQLVKHVIRNCNGCKRYRAIAFASPPTGNLPRTRTEGDRPFQVVGVDYAGPMIYKVNPKREGKAYILIFTCSLTRGIYIQLMKNQTVDEFIKSLKRFIARKGRPERIYSDNAKTFTAAKKWLKTVLADEQVNDLLAKHEIKWQFNLSRAPWWGGQFERIIGLVKQSLYKVMGRSMLTWDELEETLLDVEITLNNRPLDYIEEDVQLPILTPNSLLFVNPSFVIPEQSTYTIDNTDLRKRAKYLRTCKDRIWTRWTTEYLRGLRERHSMLHHGKKNDFKVGDIVIVKSEERNRGKWTMGKIEQFITGRDGVIRAVKVRTGKSMLERAIQQLYPMELSCDIQQSNNSEQTSNDNNQQVSMKRLKRNAAAIASIKIRDQAESDSNES